MVDLKISHVDKKVVEGIVKDMKKFGKESSLQQICKRTKIPQHDPNLKQ